MKHLLIPVIFLVASVTFFPLRSLAQNYGPVKQEGTGPWKQLGEKVIDLAAEKNSITVKSENIYYKLKFKVLDAPVMMKSIKVKFDNGKSQSIFLDFKIEKGHESRAIVLQGSARMIRSVTVNYKTVTPGFQGKSKIILYGQRLKTSPV